MTPRKIRHNPSPAEVQRVLAEIRSGWSEAEHQRRLVDPTKRATPTDFSRLFTISIDQA